MSDAELSNAIAAPRRRRAAVFVAVPMAVVLILLVLVLVTRKSAADRADFDPLEGKAAPALVGTTLDGKPFNLDAYRGEFVVLNFFATWCVPCRIEHPYLLSFAQRHQQAGDVQLITVVFNDDPQTVKDYFAQNGGTWPVVNGDQGRMALDYSVIKVPDTYIIDPLGIVRARIPRPLRDADELDATIDAIATQLYGSGSVPATGS